MGNCLDTPKSKSRRQEKPKNYRPSNNPILVAGPPEMPPANPNGFDPYQQQPYYYHQQFAPPEMTSGPMAPTEYAFMVDPNTGQEYMVPLTDPSHQGFQYYYADGSEPDVYYSNMPNGIKPKPNRRLPEVQEADEMDKGEAREVRRKSREERKHSEGHERDNGKVDIMDTSCFTTTAIVTSTSTTAATTSTVAYDQADHLTANQPTAITETSSKFEEDVQILSHPTPPPTPPPSRDREDENTQQESLPVIDDRDYGMSHPMVVSFDRNPDLIIPESKFEMTEENNHADEDELPGVVTSKGVHPPIVFNKPMTSVDVVITYSILARLESDIVRRLSSLLESSGISVWAERLGDSSRARKSDKTAKAILGAKVVVVILSEGSCHQRFIRDHVALATVINAPIYPVTTQPPSQVMEAMPLELRLQLPNNPEDWTEIGANNDESFLFSLRSLARSVQEDVEFLRDNKNIGDAKRNAKGFKRQHSLTHNLKAPVFWDVHFGHRHSVKWERMQKTIEEEFAEKLKTLVDIHSQPLVLDGFERKACGDHRDSDTVTKDRFTALCTIDNVEIDVWEAILKVARSDQAVRDVFDTESTVRHLVLDHAGEMM